MNQLNKDLGQMFKKKRIELNLTQLDVAEKLGYDSTQFISLFERGMSKIPYPVIGKLCRIYKVKPQPIVRLITSEFKSELLKKMEGV